MKVPNNMPSHKQGGIKGIIKGSKQPIEFEGGEEFFSKDHVKTMENYMRKGNTSALGKFVMEKMKEHRSDGFMKTYLEEGDVLENFDNEAFKNGIYNIESKSAGGYTATNPNSSAVGKYQFLWNTWKDKIREITGVKTKEDYLNDEVAQERFMDWHIQNNLISQIDYVRKRADKAKELSDLEIMATIHFQGAGGAVKSLNDNTVAGKNVSLQKYLTKFKEGYEQVGTIVDQSNLFDDEAKQKRYDKFVKGQKYISPAINNFYNKIDEIQKNKENADKYQKLMSDFKDLNTQLDLDILDKEVAEKNKDYDKVKTINSYIDADQKTLISINRELLLLQKNNAEKYLEIFEQGGDYNKIVNELEDKKNKNEITHEEYDQLLKELNGYKHKIQQYVYSVQEEFDLLSEDKIEREKPAQEIIAEAGERAAKRADEYADQRRNGMIPLPNIDLDELYQPNASEKAYDDAKKKYDEAIEQVRIAKQNVDFTNSFGYTGTQQDVINARNAFEQATNIAKDLSVELEKAKTSVEIEESQKLVPEEKSLQDFIDEEIIKVQAERGAISDEERRDITERQRKAYKIRRNLKVTFDKSFGRVSTDAELKEFQELKKERKSQVKYVGNKFAETDSPYEDEDEKEYEKSVEKSQQKVDRLGLRGLVDKYGGVDVALQAIGSAVGYKMATGELPIQEKSDAWKERMSQLKDRTQLGLDNQSKTLMQRQAERTYNSDVTNIGRMASSAQSALGALGAASSRKYNADLQMGALDADVRAKNQNAYDSALARDEAMSQAMWERNVYQQEENKRNVKTTLAMDAIKNVREIRREKQQFGEGSLYEKYMQAQTAETEANIAQRKASEEYYRKQAENLTSDESN